VSVAPKASPRNGGGKAADPTDDPRRQYEQELLWAETLELLGVLLDAGKITQRELAHRLGTDEGYISRVLNGGRPNLTLKTIADVGWALGYRFELAAIPLADRDATPAAADPPPPRWVAGERRRLATTTKAEGPSPL
jgi:transcriptional regulator with XRE-family HTH domain